MAETLMSMAEAGKYTNPLTTGVQLKIVEEEPMLDFIKWKQLPAGMSTYEWFDETDLPGSAFRAVGSSWTASTGIMVPRFEPISILGGEVHFDVFIKDTQGSKFPGFIQHHLDMKMRAIKNDWLQELFEGDTGIDVNGFDGLRVRASESTMSFDMSSTTDRAALTLEKIDEVLDAVHGSNSQKVIALNQWLRRKVSALVRAAGQSREMVDRTGFGQQLQAYALAPMVVIQKENDMSTILDFDEDPGDGGDDTASLYVIKFGDEEDVFGILGNGGAWELRSITGEAEDSPQSIDRISVYPGLVTAHPRAFARLHSIGKI